MKFLHYLSLFLAGVGGFSTIGVALSLRPGWLLQATGIFIPLGVVIFAYLLIVDEPTADLLGVEINQYYASLFFAGAIILAGISIVLGVILRG